MPVRPANKKQNPFTIEQSKPQTRKTKKAFPIRLYFFGTSKRLFALKNK